MAKVALTVKLNRKQAWADCYLRVNKRTGWEGAGQ